MKRKVYLLKSTSPHVWAKFNATEYLSLSFSKETIEVLRDRMNSKENTTRYYCEEALLD